MLLLLLLGVVYHPLTPRFVIAQICGPAVSVRISRGQLAGPRKEDEVAIYLQRRRASHMKPLGPISCRLTWFGEKEEVEPGGASHRCAERKGEVSPVRKAAIDGALESLGIRGDLEELMTSDQVRRVLHRKIIQPFWGGV